jgi:hypothetical protein
MMGRIIPFYIGPTLELGGMLQIAVVLVEAKMPGMRAALRKIKTTGNSER